MTLRIYDSATRELRDFEPLRPGKVGIYICGLTVQGDPHIGHVRFAVAFDQLRRWLMAGHGYDVTMIRNVTDIEDKILNKSTRAGQPWWAWAYHFERQTTHALDTLGVLPPTYEPRATAHLQDMYDLMRTLIDKGHAYQAPDGSGDVYFDVRSWPDYGSLTRQQLDDLAPAGDGDARTKRDPRDFALWKGRDPQNPGEMAWLSPFGWGRPGWHIECSAMAKVFLGDEFDIHGGGVDLRFPHHENEIAQSCAAGMSFARYWMHNAWVTMSGEKMSKSLGNSVVVSKLTQEVQPVVLRFYLGSAHYRSTIEYSRASLDEAGTSYARLDGFVKRAAQVAGEVSECEFPEKFRAAMDDDLNISGALAVVFDTVRAGNAALDAKDHAAATAVFNEVIAMTDVLGTNPLDPHWAGGTRGGDADPLKAAMDHLISGRVAARQAAREAKDFATADAIRDELTAAGIVLEDTPEGVRWRVGA